jgi:COX assembly protein 1
MVVKCREQNNILKSCIGSWYKNEQFINECTEIYLNERSEYRRTGLQKKYRTYIKERQAKLAAEQNANVQ